jgi:hypothetical protein
MTYKAIKVIGGYDIGDTVPDELAVLWLKMYQVPQVAIFKEDDIPTFTPLPKPIPVVSEPKKPMFGKRK